MSVGSGWFTIPAPIPTFVNSDVSTQMLAMAMLLALAHPNLAYVTIAVIKISIVCARVCSNGNVGSV